MCKCNMGDGLEHRKEHALTLAMRKVRGDMILLNYKEKRHNENIRGVSVNIDELHKRRSELMDEYLRMYNMYCKIWFKKTTHVRM